MDGEVRMLTRSSAVSSAQREVDEVEHGGDQTCAVAGDEEEEEADRTGCSWTK